MKKKNIALSVVAIAAVIGLAGCGVEAEVEGSSPDPGANSALFEKLPAKIQEAGEIKFAVQQHPPYSIIDGDVETGPNHDLQNAIAERLGVKAVTEEVGGGLAPVLAGVLSGRYDAFLGPIQTTPERAAEYDLIGWATSLTNYLVDASKMTSQDALVLCGSPVAFVDASQIGDQVQALSDYCEAEGEEPVQLMALADTNATLLAVKSGRAMAAGTTAGAAQYTIAQDDSFARISQPKNADGTRNNQGMVLAKDSPLTPLFLEVLEGLFEDGTYMEIMERYGLGDLAPDAPLLNPPHAMEE